MTGMNNYNSTNITLPDWLLGWSLEIRSPTTQFWGISQIGSTAVMAPTKKLTISNHMHEQAMWRLVMTRGSSLVLYHSIYNCFICVYYLVAMQSAGTTKRMITPSAKNKLEPWFHGISIMSPFAIGIIFCHNLKLHTYFFPARQKSFHQFYWFSDVIVFLQTTYHNRTILVIY